EAPIPATRWVLTTGSGNLHHSPTREPEPHAEVGILRAVEVALVKAAYLFEEIPTDELARSDGEIDFDDSAVRSSRGVGRRPSAGALQLPSQGRRPAAAVRGVLVVEDRCGQSDGRI